MFTLWVHSIICCYTQETSQTLQLRASLNKMLCNRLICEIVVAAEASHSTRPDLYQKLLQSLKPYNWQRTVLPVTVYYQLEWCRQSKNPQEYRVSLRQPRPGSHHKQGFIQRHCVIHLLRCLWFLSAAFDIHIMATHISGKTHNAADMLSRNQTAKFLKAHPDMPTFSTPLPLSILHLVSPLKLD